ncbi:hypothetical protein HS961_12395 [Comamonas piscis]|uniref:Uncharacterized protein n=1 Tax=Comamonas piscis TaxID=1562974 RepID=A0A7G5EHT6_9BURK|nr:hypothetical protein [Comamonas piscis]QMV73561.1 hypothetical protein HS961_12395 [Comamonas piscis]WSO31980.1 hypothetical protein VUJ63_12430 [Comamonas piscis]
MHTLILKKTDKGMEALRARDPALPHRMRPAFIMFDGQKSIEQVMALSTSAGGQLQVLEDIKQLLQQGLLELLRSGDASQLAASTNELIDSLAIPAPTAPPAAAVAAPATISDPGERYIKAYAAASQLVSGLGLKGFRLQLQLEKAQGYDGLVAVLPKLREVIDAKKLRPIEAILFGPHEASTPVKPAP